MYVATTDAATGLMSTQVFLLLISINVLCHGLTVLAKVYSSGKLRSECIRKVSMKVVYHLLSSFQALCRLLRIIPFMIPLPPYQILQPIANITCVEDLVEFVLLIALNDLRRRRVWSLARDRI